MSISYRLQPGRSMRVVRFAAAFVVATLTVHPAGAQVVGQSINMVTGTTWPTGDPFLERQNEPSMAVSSRNALHLVAGNNDYRTVDLPGLPYDEPTGDAWLGFFTSIDGGNSWQSTLVPGYPQDTSSTGQSSPLSAQPGANANGGYTAAADATVRAGTNGMFYYSGLAFNRQGTTISGKSTIFLARYVDDNNVQGSSTVRYLDTHIVASYSDSASPAHFADKPFMAVDMPRSSSENTCNIPGNSTVPAAHIPAGRIYIAYTLFNGGEGSTQSSIMLTYSSDCGVTWTTPQKVSGAAQTNQGATLAIDPVNGDLYIVWRIFKDKIGNPDAIAGAALQYGGSRFTPILQAPFSPFDQGSSGTTFRTNAYPTIAVDNARRLYVAWSQRGSTADTATGGDARIQLITGIPSFTGKSSTFSGITVSKIITVDPYAGRGHQIMPALAFSSGKLTVAWYDFRNDDQVDVFAVAGAGSYTDTEELPVGVVPFFSTQVTDVCAVSPTSNACTAIDPSPGSNPLRHTVDVRAAQALPGSPPQFSASVVVSEYAFGTPAGVDLISLSPDPDNIHQLEFDPPNLPLFAQGTAAFVGDYIDVAGPTFIFDPVAKAWRFNNQPGDPDHTHVVWTDNRDVVQPADGNWANYTPVGSQGGTSIFDPTQPSPSCKVGQTGVRNQDIFTATLSPGIIMGAKGNFKQLSTSLIREFPVTVQNPTNQTLYFLVMIPSQPAGGSASFLQYPVVGFPNPLTQLPIAIPPLSSASRSVFITSSNPTATVPVNAVQTDVSNNVVPNGLTSTVTLNSDTSNPAISNPNIATLEIYTPDISNPDISNPDISNPDISNPDISNPDISNVTFANPDISNPDISNPDISNPDISNPDISNPDISNVSLSPGSGNIIEDVNYTVTNTGNTSVSYAVNVQSGIALASDVVTQLIISGFYLTPVANGCTLTTQAHYIPIVNITNPMIQTGGNIPPPPPGPPPALAPTFSLEPGQQAIITIRLAGPSNDVTQAEESLLPPIVSSQGIGTLSIVCAEKLFAPPCSTTSLPPAQSGSESAYSAEIQTIGGIAPYTWTVTGWPPSALFFSATPDDDVPGQLDIASGFGPNATTQTFTVTVQVTDGSGQKAQKTFTLTVLASHPLMIITTSLPEGSPSAAATYSATVLASGGTLPYKWALTGLPQNLIATYPDPSNPAALDLTSTAPFADTGTTQTFNINFIVTDATGDTAQQTLTLTVPPG